MSLLSGDVVVVRTPGLFAGVIRLGEKLQGKPDLHNHVAVLHHTIDGVNWYLEGRPGGVGWRPFKVSADGYAGSKQAIDNAAQPKTSDQRQAVCTSMRKLFGAPYDWEAIEADAASALRLPAIWDRWAGTMPGHVVCSSAAAWAYAEAHLPAPEFGGGRFTEPGDWSAFIAENGWCSPAQTG
jgi:hypothetical protein